MILGMKSAFRFGLRHWFPVALLAGIILFTMTTNVLERMFVYFPERSLEANPSILGLQYFDVDITTRDGIDIHGWFIPQPGAPDTFLLLHGNAGNISHRLGWIHLLRGLNAHIIIVDYRGYGRSQGRPSEQGLYLDALATYEWWHKERAADASRLILIGESIGGAVAVDLAARVHVDGIVLQSTFTTAWDMAKTMFPIGLLQPLTGVRFDSAAKIKNVRCRKLFIHGDQDEIVPLRLGRKLYEMAPPPKAFHEVRGAGHNDLLLVAGEEYLQQLKAFLSGDGL
jgi:fermentation-respiration switch protein FrsA (DUF1100 family)